MVAPRSGILHQYTKTLTAFEHIPNQNAASPVNTLIFVGGLFDGLGTVPYVSQISDALPPTWSIAQVLLSSSYTGWGTSSLKTDAKELAECIAYFRDLKSGKIVLMGNSTGCQDIMEYLTGSGDETRPSIDAGLLHAPVSDREAIVMMTGLDKYDMVCKAAQQLIDEGHADYILPPPLLKELFPCPVSASRFLSLASPNHHGDDDLFSSDLTDAQLMKTFGSLPSKTPLCVVISGADQYMHPSVDKKDLLQRWMEVAKRGNGSIDKEFSGIVEKATHNLSGDPEEVVEALVKRVLGFIGTITEGTSL